MIETRSYHSQTFTFVKCESEKVMYLLLPEEIASDLGKALENLSQNHNCNIVVISGVDWKDDMTPWCVDAFNPKDDPFRGNANFYLKLFCEENIKYSEGVLGVRNAERYLVGYSLSGLFALWAAYRTPMFTCIASISGSLWYDRFADWAGANEINPAVRKIFISLGDKERKVKEPRIARVEDATKSIAESLKNKGHDVRFLLEPGISHSSPLLPRLDRALKFLMDSEDAQCETEGNK